MIPESRGPLPGHLRGLMFSICLLGIALTACGGGAGAGQNTEPGTAAPGNTPTAPPTKGANAYFDALVARPDFWKGISLRPIQGRADMSDPYYENQLLQSQFGGFANDSKVRPWVTYAPDLDEDPHKQDAAKVVVPAFSPLEQTTLALASGCSSADTVLTMSRTFNGSELFANRGILVDSEAMLVTGTNLAAHTVTVTRGVGGTRADSHSAGAAVRSSTNSLPNQLRFPIGTEDGHTYLFTWDGLWTDSYVRAGLEGHKGFQLTSGGDTIWLETQLRYGEQRYVPGATADDIGGVTLRSYNVLGGAADWSVTDGNHLGPIVTKDDPVLPIAGTLIIKPNRWTRFFVRIDQRANDYDYVDYWLADEETGPVQIYSRIPVSVRPTGKTPNAIFTWWIEMNSSQDRFVRPDLRDVVSYVRNFAVLKDPPADVSSLLIRPER